jgi:hypothetical protein
MQGRQGTHAGYTVQAVVDDKHGLIVQSDVVGDVNDRHQLAEQTKQANDRSRAFRRDSAGGAGARSIGGRSGDLRASTIEGGTSFWARQTQLGSASISASQVRRGSRGSCDTGSQFQ